MINLITKTFLQPNKKQVTVYKIFKIIDGNYYNLNGMFKFSKIDWNSCYWSLDKKRFDNIILKNNRIEYPTGFHSFMDYEQSYKVFNNRYSYSDSIFVLCECKIKFRLVYGVENYKLNDDDFETKICISRGIKILKEL